MDSNTYQVEAGRTLSGSYHGQKVTMAELKAACAEVIKAGDRIDRIKKALFYGKGDDIGLTNSIGAVNALAAPFAIAGVPIPLLTEHLTDSERFDVKRAEVILHMVIGKVTEAAEALEAVTKAMNGEPPIDRVNLLEEIGDGLWYDANLLTELESDFPTEMGRNNGKLRKRFPDKFTEHHAVNRDLGGERLVLEVGAGGQVLSAALVGDGTGEAPPDYDPVGDQLAALSQQDRDLALDEAKNLSDPVLRERFASRCRHCGLAEHMHRPDCPNHHTAGS
jgi:NTP pyrophosphatase (non-canonical NTP hydrolase)